MLHYKGNGIVELQIHMLKWVCVFLSLLIAVAFAVKYVIGTNPVTNQGLVTYFIYAAIIGSFIWSTLRCGIANNHMANPNRTYTEMVKVEHVEREGWFISTACTSFGLIGTIWGMILVSKAFIGFDPGNEIATANMVASVGTGMGAALYTTFLGQICAQILNFQYFSLSQSIEEAKANEATEI